MAPSTKSTPPPAPPPASSKRHHGGSGNGSRGGGSRRRRSHSRSRTSGIIGDSLQMIGAVVPTTTTTTSTTASTSTTPAPSSSAVPKDAAAAAAKAKGAVAPSLTSAFTVPVSTATTAAAAAVAARSKAKQQHPPQSPLVNLDRLQQQQQPQQQQQQHLSKGNHRRRPLNKSKATLASSQAEAATATKTATETANTTIRNDRIKSSTIETSTTNKNNYKKGNSDHDHNDDDVHTTPPTTAINSSSTNKIKTCKAAVGAAVDAAASAPAPAAAAADLTKGDDDDDDGNDLMSTTNTYTTTPRVTDDTVTVAAAALSFSIPQHLPTSLEECHRLLTKARCALMVLQRQQQYNHHRKQDQDDQQELKQDGQQELEQQKLSSLTVPSLASSNKQEQRRRQRQQERNDTATATPATTTKTRTTTTTMSMVLGVAPPPPPPPPIVDDEAAKPPPQPVSTTMQDNSNNNGTTKKKKKHVEQVDGDKINSETIVKMTTAMTDVVPPSQTVDAAAATEATSNSNNTNNGINDISKQVDVEHHHVAVSGKRKGTAMNVPTPSKEQEQYGGSRNDTVPLFVVDKQSNDVTKEPPVVVATATAPTGGAVVTRGTSHNGQTFGKGKKNKAKRSIVTRSADNELPTSLSLSSSNSSLLQQPIASSSPSQRQRQEDKEADGKGRLYKDLDIGDGMSPVTVDHQDKDGRDATGEDDTANHMEAVVVEWIQCDKCSKWRILPPSSAAAGKSKKHRSRIGNEKIPDTWDCSMNTWNPTYATCQAPQEVDETRTPQKSKKKKNKPIWASKDNDVVSKTTAVASVVSVDDGCRRSGRNKKAKVDPTMATSTISTTATSYQAPMTRETTNKTDKGRGRTMSPLVKHAPIVGRTRSASNISIDTFVPPSTTTAITSVDPPESNGSSSHDDDTARRKRKGTNKDYAAGAQHKKAKVTPLPPPEESNSADSPRVVVAKTGQTIWIEDGRLWPAKLATDWILGDISITAKWDSARKGIATVFPISRVELNDISGRGSRRLSSPKAKQGRPNNKILAAAASPSPPKSPLKKMQSPGQRRRNAAIAATKRTKSNRTQGAGRRSSARTPLRPVPSNAKAAPPLPPRPQVDLELKPKYFQRFKFYPSTTLNSNKTAELTAALDDLWTKKNPDESSLFRRSSRDTKGQRGPPKDKVKLEEGTYPDDSNSNTVIHKFKKIMMLLPSGARLGRYMWDHHKNDKAFPPKFKQLGNALHEAEFLELQEDDQFGYLDEIRQGILVECRRTGLFMDVCETFNKANGYCAPWGGLDKVDGSGDYVPWPGIDTTDPNTHQELDELAFALGACEIHFNTPDDDYDDLPPFEFFPAHTDKIGDLVCFLCLGGVSFNFVVVYSDKQIITSSKDAVTKVECGRKYLLDESLPNNDGGGGEDHALAFHEWRAKIESGKHGKRFRTQLLSFFKVLMTKQAECKKNPIKDTIQILVFKLTPSDRLCIPAGSHAHGTIVASEVGVKRNLAIFHQLDPHPLS